MICLNYLFNFKNRVPEANKKKGEAAAAANDDEEVYETIEVPNGEEESMVSGGGQETKN